MRDFYISVAVLGVFVVFIILNCIYINSVADELNKMVYELPATSGMHCKKQADEISKYWTTCKKIVCISVSSQDISRLSDAVDQLCSYATIEHSADYTATIKILLNAIEQMRRLEKISLDNII